MSTLGDQVRLPWTTGGMSHRNFALVPLGVPSRFMPLPWLWLYRFVSKGSKGQARGSQRAAWWTNERSFVSPDGTRVVAISTAIGWIKLLSAPDDFWPCTDCRRHQTRFEVACVAPAVPAAAIAEKRAVESAISVKRKKNVQFTQQLREQQQKQSKGLPGLSFDAHGSAALLYHQFIPAASGC